MRAYHSFNDARDRARRRLPRGLFDYVDRGVGEEASLLALRQSLDAVKIAPRAFVSEKARGTATQLFGRSCGAPFIIAPTAMAGLIHLDGEIALARAATRHGLPVCLSTQSVTSVEDLARQVPDADIWMQLYLWQDLDLSAGLMDRAAGAGAKVLVMTIDTPYGVRKEWNIRNGFGMPFRLSPRSLSDFALHPGWLLRVALRHLIRSGMPRLGNYPEGMRPSLLGGSDAPRVALRRDLRWQDVAWVRKRWAGRLILKGVMTAEDAQRAAQVGADGIVVSSHGARNFDAAPAPIEVLSQIRAATPPGVTVLADSGIRRGLDVLRYQLRGAEAVMLGRLPLWALAAGGEAGVDLALAVLRQEYVEALDSGGAPEASAQKT
ncbi:alpha-hydroxy acid oxidase [Phaeovulum sp. W22_SRMD_FR3]|uniref:alpha-hydroxy acid oxidase n=1 Tax=Phaeovulum sp. W22_SRMD_FR3 TaxID=3240274 RepID=UPI003F9E3119